MNTIKTLLSTTLLFFVLSVSAQVQVHLNVDTNPTPELFEWVNRSNLALLTVTNSEENLVGLEYRIKVKLRLDGDLVLETDNSVPIQRLEMGAQTFLADEVIPYESIIFKQASLQDKMAQTGLLPAGFYSFCVSLYNIEGTIISTPEEVCGAMLITDYVLPELLYPIDNTEIDAQLAPAILFTWTPVSPIPQPELGVKYIIAISEVLPEQSVSQAFHVNYPIIEEEIFAGTQFTWPTDLDMPDETTQYVWSIKPVTLNNNPYKSGVNGFSYIQTFTLKVLEDTSTDQNKRAESKIKRPKGRNPQTGKSMLAESIDEYCDGLMDINNFEEIPSTQNKPWEDAAVQAVKEAAKQPKKGVQTKYKIDGKLYYYTGNPAALDKCFKGQESINNSPCKRAPSGCFYTKKCKLICKL